MVNVSKRTIDYYTNLGLLTPIRSESNYRYYDETAIETLHFIEKCKSLHIPLADIKVLLQNKQTTEIVLASTDKASTSPVLLKEKVIEMRKMLEGVRTNVSDDVSKNFSDEVIQLIQLLVNLL